ncbi:MULTISPECIES: hypothetical protein [Sporolactobacillus]|uniref:Uncharacterized protein n=2 Tax=Sporolactobacillus TaxID=2077 RepID=A0A0U1QLG5_9BACL|nr:hypothetical protein [Sporolactobacillus inulinus]KLI01639.1 hypothetical protein SINU_12150 [Sporolactobacillus inulinus CASD]MBM7657829.1 hypothetical protein [Sporolactobacillus spathodeae]GEB76176.1 hypothetical protein SIN01_05210 [Sporolactobacillus inulinus]
MNYNINNNVAIFYHTLENAKNCKVMFADGSVYWQKTIPNTVHWYIIGERKKLYLDEKCEQLADVTRADKIKECKRLGLIKG